MKCTKADFTELSKEILNKRNCLRFQASGMSMYPAIRDGDILYVRPLNCAMARVGDVIFYKSKAEQLTAHRVIKKVFNTDKKVFIIRGDSNIDRGEEATLEQILGRVEAIERNGRKIILGQGWGRLADVFYVRAAPLFKYFKLIGSRAMRQVHGLRLYRKLAKRIIKGGISYQSEAEENSGIYFFAKNSIKNK